jgi:hypothetical protein
MSRIPLGIIFNILFENFFSDIIMLIFMVQLQAWGSLMLLTSSFGSVTNGNALRV